MTVSSVAISRHNTEVTLTLTSAMTLGSSYTVTMKNLTTVSGDQLPATDTYTFTYAVPTWTATMYQANWGTLGSLTDATSVVESVDDQSWSQAFTPAVLNFTTGESSDLGDFTGDILMPNETSISDDMTDIVITAIANVYIPAAGNYTFDCRQRRRLRADDSRRHLHHAYQCDQFHRQRRVAIQRGPRDRRHAGRGQLPRRRLLSAQPPVFPGRRARVAGTVGGRGQLHGLVRAPSSWSATRPTGGLALGGAVVDTTVPPAPANLRAAVTGSNNQITLTWSPVTGPAQRRRSLRDLSQRRAVRHVDHDQLHGYQRHFIAGAVFVPGGGRELRRRARHAVARRQPLRRRHRLDQHAHHHFGAGRPSPSPSIPSPPSWPATTRSAAA